MSEMDFAFPGPGDESILIPALEDSSEVAARHQEVIRKITITQQERTAMKRKRMSAPLTSTDGQHDNEDHAVADAEATRTEIV